MSSIFSMLHFMLTEINECNDWESNECSETETCVDDRVGYHCECKHGYKRDLSTNRCDGKDNIIPANRPVSTTVHKQTRLYKSTTRSSSQGGSRIPIIWCYFTGMTYLIILFTVYFLFH